MNEIRNGSKADHRRGIFGGHVPLQQSEPAGERASLTMAGGPAEIRTRVDRGRRAAAPQTRPRVVLFRGPDNAHQNPAVVPRIAPIRSHIPQGLTARTHQPDQSADQHRYSYAAVRCVGRFGVTNACVAASFLGSD